MKKPHKQILAIAALAAAFILFDVSIYNLFTKRCISDYSEAMQAKSIELDKYLPFDENSEIVRIESDFTLSGELPVLDGATALYPVYSAFMNAYYPEGSCQFDGESFTDDSLLQKRNTVGAYKAVVDGKADIIFCAQPSDAQLEYAAENGAELVQVPIGREAFVFIVNKNNPINDLSVDDIKGIYSGKYTKWSQLGGDNTLIGALQRSEGSGSQTAMLAFMGDVPMKKDYNSFLGRSIGYSFRFYTADVVSDGNVKMLSVNGIYPDTENIASGKYPVIDDFYAIYRADNTNENIPVLIEKILSEEGQDIIERTGYSKIK